MIWSLSGVSPFSPTPISGTPRKSATPKLAQQVFRPADRFPQSGPPWSGWAWEGDSSLAREPRRRAVLIVKLAAELYRRKHGRPPANAGALLDGCLKKLPNGISRDDPIPAGIE